MNTKINTQSILDSLQAEGRLFFTTQEMVTLSQTSLVATRARLRRLRQKKKIATPYREFHVIVPPRYRCLGCLPAEMFIHDLMQFLDKSYYVGLLSAAQYYGASHQTPMVFQVVVSEQIPAIECGQIRIQFVVHRQAEQCSFQLRNTEAGVIRIASPETTALELVGYPEHCGYFDNIATVLEELSPHIKAEILLECAQHVPNAWIQRLGVLFDLLGLKDLADALEIGLAERKLYTVPLASWKEMAGVPRTYRWNVALNVEVETDL